MEESVTKKYFAVRVIIVSMLFLLGSVFLTSLLFSSKEKPKRKDVSSQAISVQTRRVQMRSMDRKLEGFGTAEALKVVEVVPEISGKALYVSKHFKSGSRVRKGTLLVRVDVREHRLEYKRLKEQLVSLRLQIRLARRALQIDRRYLLRNRRLLRKKAIDAGRYEQQEIRYVERKQRLESLRQTAQTTSNQLSISRLRIQRAWIRAPFDARIVKGSVDPGDYITKGQQIAVLESRDAVEVPVSFPIDTLRSIRDSKGRPVDIEHLAVYLKSLPKVHISTSGSHTPIWEGRVVRVGGKLDLSTRTLPLWVRIPLRAGRRGQKNLQKHSRTLLPGTFCRVSIPIHQANPSIVIPRQALYGSSVYIVVNGKMHRRKIDISYGTKTTVFVRQGLRSGDRLIVSPLTNPLEGVRVQESRLPAQHILPSKS